MPHRLACMGKMVAGGIVKEWDSLAVEAVQIVRACHLEAGLVMSRELMEWIGPTPDSAIPPRVRLRLWEKCGGICQGQCGIKIRDGWEVDHIVALVNSGENRETNLQVLCIDCHAEKTGADISEKSKTYRMRAKHLGIALKPKRKFGAWR